MRLVGQPRARVATDEGPGRTDDGRVVRDFKLEPTPREVLNSKVGPAGGILVRKWGFFGINRYA